MPDSFENFDDKAWIKSLKDHGKWKCIGFQNPINIFRLLSKKLQKEIYEFLGKKILHHSIIEDFNYSLKEVGRPIGLDIPLSILEIIQNEDADCITFATVVDTKGSNDFKCQILCPLGAAPSLIIHTRKNIKQREYKLKIGWMVIDYDTDFNFTLSDFNTKLKILKTDLNMNTMLHKELLESEYDIMKEVTFVGIPVLSEFNSSNSHIIIRHHFFNEKNKIEMCTFSYCFRNNHYVNLPNFAFYTLIVIISKYLIQDAYGKMYFERSILNKLYIDLKKYNALKPKYISLLSTEENKCGPIFLKQRSNKITMKFINCDNCNKGNHALCICKNGEISKEKVECNFFDPYIR